MKLSLFCITTLALIAAYLSCSAEEEPPNSLVNGAFELGLDGWQKRGDVSVVLQPPQSGKPFVRIGPRSGAIRQRAVVGALRIVYFGAELRASTADVTGDICVQCFDSKHRMVMEQRQPINVKEAAGEASKPGTYFKTHGRTSYIEVSVEKREGSSGYFYLNTAQLNVTEEARQSKPLCRLDEYMKPFWTGATVSDETTLMLAEGGKPAAGRLMYKPQQIVSVRSLSPHSVSYVPGKDYTVEGSVITCTPGSRLPIMQSTDFEQGDLKWFNVADKQVLVTYLHDDTWHGPVSAYQGSRLPHIMDKLRKRLPVTIVAMGDSITLGVGTSGFQNRPPYMPTWPELFVRQMRQLYGYHAGNSEIRLYNTALGGTTSDWGRETAASAVASLEPDLVLIAFGMNDFWWMPEDRFRENVSAMMRDVRSRNPSAEFVLIASMRFDPAYALDPQYQTRMRSYTPALNSLTGDGVAMLDMDSISAALAAAKKPKDLISDPLHPNDFLARWYAQSLVALLDNTPARQVNIRPDAHPDP